MTTNLFESGLCDGPMEYSRSVTMLISGCPLTIKPREQAEAACGVELRTMAEFSADKQPS